MRQHYKAEQTKLYYWAASLFAVVVGASGILGAVRTGGLSFAFALEHTILFHTVFVIAWLYYLHKRLHCDLYDHLGRHAEALVASRQLPSIGTSVSPFFLAKGTYLRPRNNRAYGNSLSLVAGALAMVLYVVGVTMPVWRGTMNGESFSVEWQGPVSVGAFLVIIAAAYLWYRWLRRDMEGKIDKAWSEQLGSEVVNEPAMSGVRAVGNESAAIIVTGRIEQPKTI